MNQIPVLKPILAMLNSRKYVISVAAAGFLTKITTDYAPFLGEYAGTLYVVNLLVVGGIVAFLLGTTSWEDNNKRNNEATPDEFKDGVTQEELDRYVKDQIEKAVRDAISGNSLG